MLMLMLLLPLPLQLALQLPLLLLLLLPLPLMLQLQLQLLAKIAIGIYQLLLLQLALLLMLLLQLPLALQLALQLPLLLLLPLPLPLLLQLQLPLQLQLLAKIAIGIYQLPLLLPLLLQLLAKITIGIYQLLLGGSPRQGQLVSPFVDINYAQHIDPHRDSHWLHRIKFPRVQRFRKTTGVRNVGGISQLHEVARLAYHPAHLKIRRGSNEHRHPYFLERVHQFTSRLPPQEDFHLHLVITKCLFHVFLPSLKLYGFGLV
jgi:hypothetical protein